MSNVCRKPRAAGWSGWLPWPSTMSGRWDSACIKPCLCLYPLGSHGLSAPVVATCVLAVANALTVLQAGCHQSGEGGPEGCWQQPWAPERALCCFGGLALVAAAAWCQGRVWWVLIAVWAHTQRPARIPMCVCQPIIMSAHHSGTHLAAQQHNVWRGPLPWCSRATAAGGVSAVCGPQGHRVPGGWVAQSSLRYSQLGAAGA